MRSPHNIVKWRATILLARQVQPDLEQLERVRPVAVQQWEHLGVDDTLAGRHPLDVALPKRAVAPSESE